MVGMNRLSTDDGVRIVRCLVEGMSIRAACRMTGVAKGTALELLADLGDVCEEFHDRAVQAFAHSASSATRFGRSATPKSAR
jgi:superfamily II RNA helicase